MFITVAKTDGGYVFAAGDNPSDEPGAFFQSQEDFFLVNGLPSTYGTYGEAHAYAHRLVRSMPSIVMAKKAWHYRTAIESTPILLGSEENTVSLYNDQVNIVGERVTDWKSMDPEDQEKEGEILASEMDGIVANIESVLQQVEEDENTEELADLVEKIKDMRKQVTGEDPDEEGKENGELSLPELPEAMPAAAIPPAGLGSTGSVKQSCSCGHQAIRDGLAESAVRAFAEAAMCAVQPAHPEVFVGLATRHPDGGYEVGLSEPVDGGVRDVVSLQFDDRLLLKRIVPSQSTHKRCSYGSAEFLEKYWEPVVSAVGHVLIGDADAVAVPAFSGSGCGDMMAFKVSDGSECRIRVSPSNDGASWFASETNGAKTASSRFKDGDLKPDETQVRCTNRDLPTYYGRTGTVRKVAPKRDYADVTVDFMRGLGEVVLTDKDIEISPMPS